MHAFDRQMDTFLIASPCWHSMQRGKMKLTKCQKLYQVVIISLSHAFTTNEQLSTNNNILPYNTVVIYQHSVLRATAKLVLYAHDTLAGNSHRKLALDSSASFRRELQQNLR